MNEIDFFLRLIDNPEANKIIKLFNENTKSDDLEFKRMKIKGIFKGKTSRPKPSRKSNQKCPFEILLAKYEIPFMKSLSEKEFFILMNDVKTRNLPDYVKFANMLIHQPEKAVELLPNLDKNLKENKPLFELGYTIDSEEEMKEYVINTSIYSNESLIQNEFADLIEYVNPDEYIKVKAEKAKFQHWSLIDFFKGIKKYNENAYLVELEFILLNPKLDIKIKQYFLLDVTLELIKSQKKEMDTLNKEIERLKLQLVANSEVKINEYKNRINKLIKLLEEANGRLKSSTEEVDNYKKEKEKADATLQEMIKSTENGKKKYEREISDIREDCEERIKNITKEKEQGLEKLSRMETYWEYTFPINIENKYLFMVIHSLGDLYASRMIYPEVNFVTAENWRNSLRGNFLKQVKMIIVQRESVSTPDLLMINEVARKNGINSRVEYIGNEKKLIETIAIIKNCEFGGLTYDNSFYA